MTPIEQIRNLKQQADSANAESFDQTSIIPFATQALQVISDHPDLRVSFEDVFLERPVSWEFVSFCAHCLRWPTLKERVEFLHAEAISKNDWRAEPCFRHILDAFADDWEDAQDIYKSYFSPGAA